MLQKSQPGIVHCRTGFLFFHYVIVLAIKNMDNIVSLGALAMPLSTLRAIGRSPCQKERPYCNSQKATALAAATLRESTPCSIGMRTV